jgi:hypothetical protein
MSAIPVPVFRSGWKSSPLTLKLAISSSEAGLDTLLLVSSSQRTISPVPGPFTYGAILRQAGGSREAGRAQNRPQRDPAAHPILLDADRRGYATSRTWPALVQPDQQPFRDPSVAPGR